MKNKTLIALTLLSTFLIIPITSFAQINEEFNDGFNMMMSLEDRALGDELQEEMEVLMIKMMSGNMTESEAGKMIEFMNQYPGPQAMMMNRMLASQYQSDKAFNYPEKMMGNYNVMNGINRGTISSLHWFLVLMCAVWFVVGILAIIWLWKQINK
jgi:hypothetical protein